MISFYGILIFVNSTVLKLRWQDRNIPHSGYQIIRVTGRRGSLLPFHTHDYPEIFWIEQGRCRHEVNGTTDIVTEGEIVFIRPSDIHRLSAIGGKPFHLLNVECAPPWMDKLAQMFPREYLSIYPKQSPHPAKFRVRDRFTLGRMHEFLTSRPASGLTLVGWWITLVTHLFALDEPELPQGIPDWLAQGCREMRKPEALRGGVEYFAQLTGRCEAHLTRSCRRYLHQSAMEYVIQSRMAYARSQLMFGTETIKEIAETCGYNSLSQFYKNFERSYDESPARFRKIMRVG